MSAQGSAQLRAQLQAIRIRQQQIEEAIKSVRAKLEWAEKRPPMYTPYVTFRHAKDFEDFIRHLRAPPQTVQQILRHNLLFLRQELRPLSRESAAIRHSLARESAHRSQREFKARVKEVLKKSEEQGFIDGAELERLIQEGEQSLNRLLGILDAVPSDQNADAVLDTFSSVSQLGGAAGALSDRSFESLARAGSRMHEKAERAFREKPTADNLKRLLRTEVLGQQLGSEMKETPDGWRPVNKKHTTHKGDSLSSLSQRYYGSTKFWDVIFRANPGLKHPDVLPEGLELEIP